MARHCYNIELQGKKAIDDYPVKGLDAWDDLTEWQGEPVEDLIPLSLTNRNPEYMVRIGSNMDQVIQDRLTLFLQENANIFVWALADMLGIDPLMMVHQLKVDLKHRPVKQKMQSFVPEHQKAIAKDVDKLLDIGFIKETIYP